MNQFMRITITILAWGVVVNARGSICGSSREIDTVNLHWAPLSSTGGTTEAYGYQTGRLALQPGLYHVQLRIKLDQDHVPFGSVLTLQLLSLENEAHVSTVVIPLPVNDARVATAEWNWVISRSAAKSGVMIVVTANCDVRVVIEQFRLTKMTLWSKWWLRTSGALRLGQASLRTQGILNSVPAMYRYPLVIGTNHVYVTAESPELELLGGVTLGKHAIELTPGPASVRAIAHRISLRERTCYRLRVHLVGSAGHAREDRIHCDVYSAVPLYDPPDAEVVVTGPLLRLGRHHYDCYFRTAEVPPAVMLRIMAALTSTTQVTGVSLKQISYAHYLTASVLPCFATGRPSMVILPVLIGVGAVAVWMLNGRRRVTRHLGVFVTCALSAVAVSFGTRAEGIWFRGNAISMLIGGMLLWVLCGWWVWWLCRRVFGAGYTSLMSPVGAFAWLICGLTGLSWFMPMAYALTTFVLVTAVLGILAGSKCGWHMRERAWESWEWLCVISIWMLGMAIMLGPYGDQGLKGFFSECIDGFMYATTSEYLLDPAKARTTWDSQVLEYIRQVTELVRRPGTMVTYAAYNYLTGEPAAVTYRLWHATIHACVGVTSAGIARQLGARRWAAWMAGVYALTIPVVQLPVFGNSLAQSGGLLCLSGLSLLAVAALQWRLSGLQRLVLLLLIGLLVLSLLMVYREMMVYVVLSSGIYILFRLGRLWMASKRWRVALTMAAGVLAGMMGIWIKWHGVQAIGILVRRMITQYFPYLDAGDIRTRLGPWHVLGGVDLAPTIGVEGKVAWAPLLGGVMALAGALVALYGVLRLSSKLRDGALAVLISCAGLYVLLAVVIPWPYALKKHLSVCGVVAASLVGVGLDQLLRVPRSGWRLVSVVMVMLLLMGNSVITWKIFLTAAEMPHYFDHLNEELRDAVQRYVPRNTLIFVDTDERMEKFFYTLRHHRVTDTDGNKASYAVVRPDRRTALSAQWGGERHVNVLYRNERFELLTRDE